MKKAFYPLLVLLVFAALPSCKKEGDHTTKQVVIDTILASGAAYQLNLQSYGDADDVASITKQATNFTTSEITNTSGGFAPVYHYLSYATAKAALTDQVVLAVAEGNHNRGNGNCNHPGDSTIITINFTVK